MACGGRAGVKAQQQAHFQPFQLQDQFEALMSAVDNAESSGLRVPAQDDPEAWQFLVWLAKTRAGEDPGRIGEIDADILGMNPRPKVMPDEAEESEPGPTGSPESDTP